MEIPYNIICEIGHGAHGKVYLAEGTNGRVALKVCRKPEDSNRCENWERELRGWLLLKNMPPHLGIVRIYDVGYSHSENVFWVAMELADSEDGHSIENGATYRPKTLASLVSAELALPISQCLNIAEDLALALVHLQRNHLLHRDIKPDNIMQCANDRVKLADLGLAGRQGDDVNDDSDEVVGTPQYISPEQLTGVATDTRSDIYSLGATF